MSDDNVTALFEYEPEWVGIVRFLEKHNIPVTRENCGWSTRAIRRNGRRSWKSSCRRSCATTRGRSNQSRSAGTPA